MSERRWALPEVGPVPPREALLLLPELPPRAAVLDSEERWLPALAAWGCAPAGDGAGGASVAIGADARRLAASGAAAVLLEGADRRGHLSAAGYSVLAWRMTRTQLGTSALVPVGHRAVIRQLRTGGSRRRPRQVAADLVRLCQPGRIVTVGARGEPMPGPVRRLPLASTSVAALLVGEASARRRPVFLVLSADGRPRQVVKIGFGEEAARRSRNEQAALATLAELAIPGAPAPLGHGVDGGLTWSAETAVAGRPLGDVLATSPPADGLRALERIADYLTDLAIATRGPLSPDLALQLRPPYERAGPLAPRQVLGVLVHGDFHGNVLLDEGRIGVIDWELARPGGLPLHDLMPLLCKGLAAVRRVHRDQVPSVLLPVLRGEGPDGEWMLGQVRRALGRLEVPLELGARLTAVSLASWASKRVVHDELVRAAGGQVTNWSSAADVLAPAWLDDPLLGDRWPALTADP